MRAPGGRAGWLWGVAAVSAVALALRIPGMGQSLLGDELSTWDLANRSAWDSLATIRGSQEITPPLFFALTWLTSRLGDDPDLWLRLPSLLAGVATVPLTALLGALTVGRWAGLAGAALMAVSPFAIWYSDEARAYAVLTLLVVLAALALVHAVRDGRRRYWIAWALLAGAAMLTHYTAVFPLAAMALWAAWAHRERMLALVLACGGAVLVFLPWLPFFLEDRQASGANALGANGIGILLPFSGEVVAQETSRWLAGVPFEPVRDLPGAPALGLLALALLVALAGALAGPRRPPGPPADETRGGTALVVALALAAPVGALLGSLAGPDVYAARNLLASLPFVALAAGRLLTAGPRPVAWAASALAVAGLGIGALRGLDEDHRRPATSEALRVAAAEAPDPVILERVSFDPRDFGNALAPYAAPGMRTFRAERPAEVRAALRAASDGPLVVVTIADDPLPSALGAGPPGRPVLSRRTIPGVTPLLVTVYGPPSR